MKLFGKKKASVNARLGGFLKNKFLGDFDIQGACSKIVPFLKDFANKGVDKYNECKDKMQDIPGTNYDLGLYHMKNGNFNDAIMRFKMVCYLKPDNIDSLYNLGRCHLLVGENEKAKKKLHEVLTRNKDYTEAKYLLQKIESPEKIESIPFSLIKETVDIRASYYRDDYVDAGYEGSKLLVAEVMHNITDKNPSLTTLDLGCGIGGCGLILKDRGLAKHVTGVDLSHLMIKYSASRKVSNEKVYDNLHEAEIGDYLKSEKSKYDLVLADLSLDFLGKLEPIANSIKNVLNAGGYLGIIARQESELKDGYVLNVDYEDFSYSDKYIQESFKKSGLNLLSTKEIEIVGEEKGNIYVFST